MSVIYLNGKKIEFNGNVVINIKKDLTTELNSKKFDTDDKSRLYIEINGNINNLNVENSNINIIGNVINMESKDNNVKCNVIKDSKIKCMKLESNFIKGNIYTNDKIFCNTFIGDVNKNKDDIYIFNPIKDFNVFKSGQIIYHKTHGKGKISYVSDYANYKSISINFDNGEYKNIKMESIINNNNISLEPFKLLDFQPHEINELDDVEN